MVYVVPDSIQAEGENKYCHTGELKGVFAYRNENAGRKVWKGIPCNSVTSCRGTDREFLNSFFVPTVEVFQEFVFVRPAGRKLLILLSEDVMLVRLPREL